MEGRFDEDAVIDEEIRDVIRTVLGNVDDEIRKLWLQSQVIPTAVEEQMLKIDRIVAWATYAYDGAVTTEAAPLEKYTPDGEPAPASIDTWARGTVPLRKPPPKEPDYLDSGLTSARSRTNSVSSRQSGSSKQSGTSRRYGSTVRGTSRGNDKMDTLFDDDHPEIFMLEDEEDDEDMHAMNESRRLFKQMQHARMSAEASVASLESEEDEFSILQAQVDKAAKDLKGKKYIMDKDGNPIMLNPIKPDKLPPFLMPVKMNITNVQTADEKAAAEKAAQAAKNKGKGKGKGGKGPRVAGARQMEASYFVPSTSLTTTLANTEPALNPGVSMRGRDNSVREGGEIPEEYARPSRKAYAARVASASMTSPGFEMSMSRGGFGAGGLEESTASFGIGDINGGDSVDALPMSMSLLHQKMSAPDIDPLEGSRRLNRNPSDVSQE